MIRDLRPDEVEFTLIQTIECSPIQGNCSAIDEETDRETENWIKDQLKDGNDWAWCEVEVKATWKGISSSDYLGCCSYASEADFKALGGYWDIMKAEALLSLNAQLANLDHTLSGLRL